MLFYQGGNLLLAGDEKDKDAEPSWRQRMSEGFTRLMRFLHQQKEMSPSLMRRPEVQQFVSTTASVLNQALEEGIRMVPPSDKMTERLKDSNLVFSGFKTFHQMNEAFPSLLDADGNRKPFEQFLNDVQKVDETYNSQYLKAEYNFAIASSQMAAKWEKFAADGDRYNLQYRTAYDDKVRDSHVKLHDITLPVNSPFWDEYFPPNGWGCRCIVVQVRKSKYAVSDEQEALNRGSQATTGKHQELFRFNPGKRQACYPAYNPYTIKKCATCSKSGFKLAKVPNNELCAVCKVVLEMKKAKEDLKAQRTAIKEWAKENLLGKTVLVNKISNPIEFTMTGIKETLNQPHKRVSAKNEALRNIVKLLRNGTYVKECFEEKGNPMVSKYHYVRIEIGQEPSYAIIRELTNGRALFYSIVEKIKE